VNPKDEDIAELLITEFTDPGWPFAWSAEPHRRRLEWLYGEQLGRLAHERHLGFDGLWSLHEH